MTREEEIISEAKKYYSGNIQCYDAFLHGTEFADKHPKNVWHNRSERPKLGEFVVFEELIEGKHKYYSLFRWERSLEVGYLYNSDITRWACIEDLLPKGGEK